MSDRRNGQRRPYKPVGRARPLAPVKESKRGRHTGWWLARIVDVDGARRQVGRERTKSAAAERAHTAANERNDYAGDEAQMTLLEWNARWPERRALSERTVYDNAQRMSKYVLPHMPRRGDIPLTAINRAMVRDVQIALLRAGLAKATIDGAISTLSAVLGYALDEDLIDVNPAHRMRVNPDDARLQPKRPARPRRVVSADELAAFIAAVPPRWRACCLTPVATGVRPQELFALRTAELNGERQTIFVYERAHRLGGPVDERIIPGLKTSRGIRHKPKEQLGRETIFPAQLITLLDEQPTSLTGLLYPTVRGRVWSQRNFYRTVWRPAQRASGTDFVMYDLRHTFASRLRAGGVPLIEIAGYLGHSTRQLDGLDNTTSRIYTHATGEHRDLALRVIHSFLANGLRTRDPRR
jgi:integrase